MLGNIPNTILKSLVILGAGASYDLVNKSIFPDFEESIYRPPLTDSILNGENELYNKLQKGSLVQNLGSFIGLIRLKMRVGHSLESAIDTILNSQEVDTTQTESQQFKNYLFTLMREVSKYNTEKYSGNNYEIFFRLLRRVCSEFCVVNFNYDYIAQKALEDTLYLKFNTIDSYIQQSIKLIQIHGSILWREMSDGSISVDDYLTGGGSADSLTIPHSTAKKFGCPNEHIDALQLYMKDVNIIIIIGWQGREPHFNNLLKLIQGVPKRIIIICGKSIEAKQIAENSGLDRFQGALKMGVSGFSNALIRYHDFSINPDIRDQEGQNFF